MTVVLAGVMGMSLAGCGGNDKGGSSAEIKSAEEILTTVWDAYEEDDRFFAMGGSYNDPKENMPGTIPTSDTEGLSSILVVPEADAAMLDDAASLVHSMNANTFTAGAYHVADAGDTKTFTTDMKDAMLNKHWMCGSPETIKIYQLTDTYVVTVFGAGELVDNFEDILEEKYPSVEAVADESL